MPKSAQFTITSTAQIVVPANIAYQSAYLHNGTGGGHGGGGAVGIFIGNADVTSANGYLLDGEDKLTVLIGDNEALYAVTASGTATLYVLNQIH
jgi:hypothetical protein